MAIMTEEECFRSIYTEVSLGGECKPRGERIREVENFRVTFPPYYRWMNFEHRKLSPEYIRREFRWYLRGDPFDTSIDQVAKIWGLIRSSEGAVNSNYGCYIFQNGMFEYLLKTLKDDPDSRRASVCILDNDHLREPDNKDFPCTYALNFRIRMKQLNMSVHMRSQDVWFGMGNDVPTFSFTQELLAAALLLPVGNFHLAVDSLHAYERNWKSISEIVKDSAWLGPVKCPKIFTVNEAMSLVHGEPDHRFEFTNWLYQEKGEGEPYP